MLSVPPSYGKTYIMVALGIMMYKKFGNPTLIVVPDKLLLEQQQVIFKRIVKAYSSDFEFPKHGVMIIHQN